MKRNRIPVWLPVALVVIFGAGMVFHSLTRGEVTYKLKVYNSPKSDQPYAINPPSRKHPVNLIPAAKYYKTVERTTET